jgi:hypothetical protein
VAGEGVIVAVVADLVDLAVVMQAAAVRGVVGNRRTNNSMKKIIFAVGLLLITSGIVTAQSIRTVTGKKFGVTILNTTITNMSMMGQDLEMNIGSNAEQEYEVKTVTASGFSLLLTLKRITGSASVMGQEQKFDSDDEATRNIPGMGELFKQINKQQEIKVENGKTISSGDTTAAVSGMGMNLGNLLDVSNLFLTVPIAQLKQGYSWTDSSISENTRTVNQYLVTSTANQQVEVKVSTDTKIKATLQQGGVEVKQDMKGFSTATRLYDSSNGLLISEKLSLEMTGTAEVMGMNAPMTVKTTITTTVK